LAEPWYRVAFGAFYPLLYAHRDEAEARRCLDLLPRLAPLAAPGARTVLDLGCGDGRHLAWLRAAGVPAVGLDLSAALLAAARGRGLPLVRGDMRRLPVRDGGCGAVLSLFTAFGYFGRDGDAAVAAGVARALAPGGHWFLDYLDAPRVRAELAAGEVSRDRVAGPLAVHETRRLDSDPPAVVKAVVLAPRPGAEGEAAGLGVGSGGLRFSERVALYEPAELDALAGAAGLARVAAAGDYDGAPLGSGPRCLLVYRKDGPTCH
jgi:SAM-dependent methyltransferase